MPWKFIDGMRVFVDPKDDGPNVGVDIEDLLYEDRDTPDPTECDTLEEFQSAMIEYSSAQLLKFLPQNEGYAELVKIAKQRAKDAWEAERRYTGPDVLRQTVLRQNRIIADCVLAFVCTTVENAALVPRPTFNR